jgi:hypothetical protein
MKVPRLRGHSWKPSFTLVLATAALAVAGYAYSSDGPNAQLVGQDRVWGGGGTEPGCFVPDIGFCRLSPNDFAIDAHATRTAQAAYGDRAGSNAHDQITAHPRRLDVRGQNGRLSSARLDGRGTAAGHDV